MGSNSSKRKDETKVVQEEKKEEKEEKSMHYKLKKLYKQLNIPQAACMGDRMELPIQEFYIKLKLTSSNRVVHHHEMFKQIKTKRILVEGLPGYGKTTLATKIAYDWAINEEYTRRFHLVFLLSIRELRHKSVIGDIVGLIRISGFDKLEEVERIIEKDEDNILLILDGLDEAAPNQRKKILKILYQREMTQMTVVVTCRSGEFSLKPDEGRALFSGLSIKTEFCDQRITILGIQNRDKEEFLKKFLHKTEFVDKVIEYLKNVTETTREFFDSPLMLILLADMVVRGNKIGPTTTRTNFYKDVVNFMIRRSQERRNVYLSKSFDVFGAKSKENGSFKVKLQQFGHLCFKRVWDGHQLEFNEDKLIKNIHQLGLVTVHKKLSNVSFKNYYQIYHRTILEFMAAYYMHQQFLHNNLVFPKLIEQTLFKDVYWHSYSSMVTPFLIGLMQDKASHYFLLISSKYIDLFQDRQYALGRILIECENLTQVKHSLIPNLPTVIKSSSFYSSQIYKGLISLGVQSGRLQNIFIASLDEIYLLTDIELPMVQLCSEKVNVNNAVFTGLKQFKCQRFHWCTLHNEKEINKCFQLLPQISAKVHVFVILDKAALYFLNKQEKWPANMEFERLCFDFTYSAVFEKICNLLDKCQIHTLYLTNVIDNPELINILSHCKNVKHLELQGCQVSMDTLFSNKQWLSIKLWDVELIDPAVKDFYECKSVKLYSDTLISCAFTSKISEISNFRCNYGMLFQLMTCSSWQGFQTITEIDLSLNSLLPIVIEDNCEFWKGFHLFHHLECLRVTNWDHLESGVQKQILANVLLLPIRKLILNCIDFPHKFVLSEHLSVILKNIIVKSLKTLIIHLDYLYELKKDDVLKCIDILQYCSEKKMSLNNIDLVTNSVNESIFEMITVSNVNINYSFAERSVTVLLSINN